MKETISKKELKVKSKKELIELIKDLVDDFFEMDVLREDAVKKYKALLEDFNALKDQNLGQEGELKKTKQLLQMKENDFLRLGRELKDARDKAENIGYKFERLKYEKKQLLSVIRNLLGIVE